MGTTNHLVSPSVGRHYRCGREREVMAYDTEGREYARGTINGAVHILRWGPPRGNVGGITSDFTFKLDVGPDLRLSFDGPRMTAAQLVAWSADAINFPRPYDSQGT